MCSEEVTLTVALQLASLVALFALFAAWGFWVWEAHRPISAPEKLGEVVVHGVDPAMADATARAVAVGVVGAIAEHYRTVDFINTAAETADEFRIRAGGAAPEPLLLQGRSGFDDDRLDLTVEVAGAKIDSKGLTSLFRRTDRARGSLALAISLTSTGQDGSWRATASASFPENSKYGFRTEASGTIDEVAQVIGLRFVQAHYAAGDPFFAALGEDDFRKLWEVRREAAELALRGAEGDPSASDPLRQEAKAEYRKIAHLLTRYRRRVELQKLGSYLATAEGDLTTARQHVEDARKHTTDEEERRSLEALLASLEVEVANRAMRSPQMRESLERPAASTLDDELEDLARLNGSLIEALNLAALRGPGALRRPPRIGVVMGRPPEEWDDRVEYVGATHAAVDPVLTSHSGAVLSLIAALAPGAEIVLSPIAGLGQGSTSQQELQRAIGALAGQSLDVTFWPLGESAVSFGKEDGGQRWAASAGEKLAGLAGFQGLAVLPAGNDGVDVPAPRAASGAPVSAVIGASDGIARAPYSNFGSGVDFFAPGSAVVMVDGGTAEQRGTSFSSAAFVAGAALLAASLEEPSGARLLEALERTARTGPDDNLRMPDFGAAAEFLAGPPGG